MEASEATVEASETTVRKEQLASIAIPRLRVSSRQRKPTKRSDEARTPDTSTPRARRLRGAAAKTDEKLEEKTSEERGEQAEAEPEAVTEPEPEEVPEEEPSSSRQRVARQPRRPVQPSAPPPVMVVTSEADVNVKQPPRTPTLTSRKDFEPSRLTLSDSDDEDLLVIKEAGEGESTNSSATREEPGIQKTPSVPSEDVETPEEEEGGSEEAVPEVEEVQEVESNPEPQVPKAEVTTTQLTTTPSGSRPQTRKTVAKVELT